MHSFPLPWMICHRKSIHLLKLEDKTSPMNPGKSIGITNGAPVAKYGKFCVLALIAKSKLGKVHMIFHTCCVSCIYFLLSLMLPR